MVVVIDASNIRTGGGLTHLNGILKHYDVNSGFSKVVVYSNTQTLGALPERSWLVKETHQLLNKSALWSFVFQIFILSSHARKRHKCDIVFVPGGTFLGSFRPFVAMSRNMLPFEWDEARRFISVKDRIRFLILFVTQAMTFKMANGLIFLTVYAKNVVFGKIKKREENIVVIPHGVSSQFEHSQKTQLSIDAYSKDKPFRFLYVSAVNPYKHQWNVAEAVLKLREEGFPVVLDLVGPGSGDSLDKVLGVIESKRNTYNCVRYVGEVEHNELAAVYGKADAFIFASSCENMPNILVEAMTAGLPIASSCKGPMPEVLKDGGVYFDPVDVDSIYESLKKMVINKDLREKIQENACRIGFDSWSECSRKTFEYLLTVASKENAR